MPLSLDDYGIGVGRAGRNTMIAVDAGPDPAHITFYYHGGGGEKLVLFYDGMQVAADEATDEGSIGADCPITVVGNHPLLLLQDGNPIFQRDLLVTATGFHDRLKASHEGGR